MSSTLICQNSGHRSAARLLTCVNKKVSGLLDLVQLLDEHVHCCVSETTHGE